MDDLRDAVKSVAALLIGADHTVSAFLNLALEGMDRLDGPFPFERVA
jgi:hypothetical protein